MLSFFSVLFELELLRESSQFQFIYGILKRHTSVSIAKHGAFISLMLCRSDTIKNVIRFNKLPISYPKFRFSD